jgi:glycosyltransferase involved in cell wall biosynthesis
MGINVLVIRTDFGHHGDQFGYKQILKFTHPYKVIGIDERNKKDEASFLKKKYPWLFEFTALKFRNKVDLIHILYGEDYYRWSGSLFKRIPVVVTFHQPAETLMKEVLTGDVRGRIGRITHSLTRSRFKKLSAAIVTSPSQISILEKVMPLEKIHYIPIGLHVETLNEKFGKREEKKISTPLSILTVGTWMRDWDFYFKIVEACPDFNFHLVDRKISKDVYDKVTQFKNLTYHADLSDDKLFSLYLRADLQFLPVSGVAGSNAFLQGLALGCPTLITDLGHKETGNIDDFILYYDMGNVSDCINKINEIAGFSESKRKLSEEKANAFSNQFSWQEIANKTMNLYKTLI